LACARLEGSLTNDARAQIVRDVSHDSGSVAVFIGAGTAHDRLRPEIGKDLRRYIKT
jgi:hypothetical protein